jgi:transcriptional/translational regulatory protein YebC/TACO1
MNDAMRPHDTNYMNREALTDNKKRTFSDVRAAFSKYGGNLSPTLFQFERKGYIIIDPSQEDFDTVFEKVLELGADDIEEVEGEERAMQVITEAGETGRVAGELKQDYKIKEVGIAYLPKDDAIVEITEPEVREKYDKFVQILEDLEDVTDYYTTLKD